MAVGNSPGQNFIFLNLSSGQNWKRINLLDNEFRTYDIISLDINNDGKIDIIEANSDESNFYHIIK